MSGEKSLKTMDALHATAMLKYWWALIEIIRWGCTWQRTTATPATPLPAAVQRGISAGWFFISDPISACTSALFSQVCVPAEWRWARLKITLHIHLPNWLLNAATGGWRGGGEKERSSDSLGLKMQFLHSKHISLWRHCLAYEFIAHLSN